MQFTIVSGAAVLLALAPTALAQGSAIIVNNCGVEVFYAAVSQNVAAPMQPMPASGVSVPYSNYPDNDGVSLKLALSSTGKVAQFEFTKKGGDIYYDISHIDGNPFEAYGTSLTPSMLNVNGYPTCVVVDCPAGTTCANAYNLPDDVSTKVCPESANMVYELCTAGGPNNSQTRSVDTSTQTTSVQPNIPSAAPSEVPSWPGSGHWHGRQHARHLPKK